MANWRSQDLMAWKIFARVVYKDPQFLFFDKASSALDTQSELIIMGTLAQFLNEALVLSLHTI